MLPLFTILEKTNVAQEKANLVSFSPAKCPILAFMLNVKHFWKTRQTLSLISWWCTMHNKKDLKNNRQIEQNRTDALRRLFFSQISILSIMILSAWWKQDSFISRCTMVLKTTCHDEHIVLQCNLTFSSFKFSQSL